MADTPAIDAARIRLEPFAERHVSDMYVAWLNDPQVVRFSRQRHRKHTREDCLGFLRSFAGSDNLFWAIVLRENGAHLGNITVDVEPHDKVASVNILVGATSEWGKGYGFEAFDAACTYLLRSRGMRKVFAGTMETNAPMRRLMQKCGMAEEARFEQHYFWEGAPIAKVFGAKFSDT